MDSSDSAGSASILFTLLRPGVAAGPGPGQASGARADWGAVAALSRRHGVAPLLLRALESRGEVAQVPVETVELLTSERRATAMRNLRHYAEFGRICLALGQKGIACIPLKGLHLAERVYADISLRPMSDLDILVHEQDVPASMAVLRSLDYGADADLGQSAHALLQEKCNLGFRHCRWDVWVELHWKLSEPGDFYSAPMPDIWRTAVPARIGGADALVMSPEFLLLHVCAHLACNHLFSFDLRALADIAEICRAHPGLDWEAFGEQARRHRWRRGVALALALARRFLDAPIPDRALDAVEARTLDPGLVSEALAQLLASPDLPQAMLHAPNLMGLRSGRAADRLRVIARRLFVPRAELALLYGVPETSRFLPLYYGVRARDLLGKYAAGARALRDRHSPVSLAADRRDRLAGWVFGGDPWSKGRQ